jgi:predicted outer membrane repeat protein
MNVRFQFGLPSFYRRKVLFFVSLFFMATLVSSCIASVFSGVSPFVSGVPDELVTTEVELQNVISNSVKPIVIALANDITLTDSLVIPYSKDITLTSNNSENTFHKLIGADGESTIVVETRGVLKLDGIIVTHMNGAHGNGIFVNFGGILYLYAGAISNNTAPIGGGVCTDGDFTVSGGVISGNTAKYNGGGVYVGNGVLSNTGGVISDNIAPKGNNVYTSDDDVSGPEDNSGTSNGNDYSLMAVIVICVCIVGLTTGVVAVGLFFYFRKRMKK